MKKKRFLLALFIISIITLLFIFPAGAKKNKNKVYKIGIAQFLSVPPLDAARQGFIDQMTKEGFIEGQNVEYEIDNAETDMSVTSTIARKFASQGKDLILAITTPMSQACVAATENSDIPIVFSCVTDPVAAGIVDSWKKPGGRVTGVSDWMDVEQQVEIIKMFNPKIKKVGTLYNAGETNSRVQIAELKKAAKKLGFKIVEANASSSTDVMAGAKSLVGRVQAIWLPTDNTVVGSLEAVVKVCEDNGIPLFGSDTSQVHRGAIASTGMDFYQIGEMSGKIAADILRGKDPAKIPVAKSELTLLTINLAAAERMGIDVPQKIKELATEIIEK